MQRFVPEFERRCSQYSSELRQQQETLNRRPSVGFDQRQGAGRCLPVAWNQLNNSSFGVNGLFNEQKVNFDAMMLPTLHFFAAH